MISWTSQMEFTISSTVIWYDGNCSIKNDDMMGSSLCCFIPIPPNITWLCADVNLII